MNSSNTFTRLFTHTCTYSRLGMVGSVFVSSSRAPRCKEWHSHTHDITHNHTLTITRSHTHTCTLSFHVQLSRYGWFSVCLVESRAALQKVASGDMAMHYDLTKRKGQRFINDIMPSNK
jgi:hypothetical protein